MAKRIATLKEIADVLIKALGDKPPPVKKQTWSNWITQKGKGKILELPRAALSLGIEPNALLLRDADEVSNEDQVLLQQIRVKLITLRQIYSGAENPLETVAVVLDSMLRLAYERAGVPIPQALLLTQDQATGAIAMQPAKLDPVIPAADVAEKLRKKRRPGDSGGPHPGVKFSPGMTAAEAVVPYGRKRRKRRE